MSVVAADPVRRPPAPARGRGAGWWWTASVAAAGAGLLHVAAAVGHLAAGDLVVGLFLLTALAQLGLGAWLVAAARTGRGGFRPLAVAVAGTTLLVGLHLLAHTTDLLTGLTGHDAAHPVGHVHGGGAAAHAAGASIATDGPIALDDRPTAGAEAPGLLGTATVALELLAIAAMTALLPAHLRRRVVDTLLVLGGLAWVLWLTGVLA